MNRSLQALLLFVLLFSLSVNGQVFVGGILQKNTTYSKDKNPYIVTQDLIVPEGITLTILPGTQLKFAPFTRLITRGTLVAAGTAVDSVFFTLHAQNPNQSLWNGLQFENCTTVLDPQGNYASGTVLSYASIFNTNYSLTLSNNSSILIEHSDIRKSSFGIYMNDAHHCILRYCRIRETAFGIFIPSGVQATNNLFLNNRIENNYSIALLINNSAGLVRHNDFLYNEILDNYIGMYIGNDGPWDAGYNNFTGNLITGNELEGVRIYQDSTGFTGNRVTGNGVGVSLRHTNHSHISGNIISENAGWGILIADSASGNLLEKNNIFNNTGGICIESDSASPSRNNTFLYNTLYQNSGESFRIGSAPQSGIHYNALDLAGDTNTFINNTPALIHAEYNWWGTTDHQEIDQTIFDQLDDPSRGLVLYDFPLDYTDSLAPMLPPEKVVKKQTGEDVLITWQPSPSSDIKGYLVYFGALGGIFNQVQDVGNVNSCVIPDHSVFDSIAVSAYDQEANGQNDHLEGHESESIVALLSPYAGPDTTICFNATLRLDKATAFNYESIYWTTSGDGSFDGAHILKPVYAPGQQDYMNGEVQLTLTIIGADFNISDELVIHFIPLPVSNAGADTVIFSDTLYRTVTAFADNHNSVLWTTSGDGFFSDDSALITDYHPGTSDMANGGCILTLKVFSPCGEVSDQVEIALIKNNYLNGRVHADTELARGSSIQTFIDKNGLLSQVRSTFITDDGNFSIGNIANGDYYLYVIPDREIYPGFAPTYYFNKVHWEDAYSISVMESTYDLDVELLQLQGELPHGEAGISGRCMTSGSGQQCSNTIILLYDKTGTYLLGWTEVQADGTFHFEGLPFGDYMLAGEKAGYERFFSQLIALNQDHPNIDNVEVRIESLKISIRIPDDPAVETMPVVFPNPVRDKLYLCNLQQPSSLRWILATPDGKLLNVQQFEESQSLYSLDFSGFSDGVYFLSVFSAQTNEFVRSYKIIKY